MAWKNTMHVFHTAGVPPNSGNIILPTIGSTRNSSDALQNNVKANTPSMTAGKGRFSVSGRAVCCGRMAIPRK
jgi:hypothetical protein